MKMGVRQLPRGHGFVCDKCLDQKMGVQMEKKKIKTRPPLRSRPGVCDVCGCAVVRSHTNMHKIAEAWEVDVKIDGHTYTNGVLERVRCALHSEDIDEAPAEDARGGTGDHRKGMFVRELCEGSKMPRCCEKEYSRVPEWKQGAGC
jgi:hypothetical protein